MTKNQEKLKAIMENNKLNRRMLALFLGVSIKTVESWLTGEGNASYRKIPNNIIELLQLKLRD